MKLRGPGDLFGIRQSGEFSFKIGDIYTDANILKAASEAVNKIDAGYLSEEEMKTIVEYMREKSSSKVDFRTI